MTQKIAINRCYGGFSLSAAGLDRYAELSGITLEWHHGIARDDPHLIAVIEEMGDGADGRCAHLKVCEIPDGVSWTVQEYDGIEWVAETHRTWGEDL